MAGDRFLHRTIDRRTFIKTTAVTAGAAALTLAATECDPALIRRIQQNKTPQPLHHRVWLWQFSTDGSAEAVAETLAANNLGVLVKTHDGVEWMSRYDRSSQAISGPAQVERIARIFENAGVPFHAWSVPKGLDPVREAQMTADVMSAGARSLCLDLEGSSGFWVGSSVDMLRFGDELRRLNPFGRIDVSIDPRPWRINLVPMLECVAFTDAIWPQLYWDTFNNPANIDGYRNSGFPVGSAGMTPEFLLDTTDVLLAQYGRDVIPVGQGAAADPNTWGDFVARAWALGMGTVSVWRHGVTPRRILDYLGDNPAGEAPKPIRTPTPEPTGTRTSTPTRTATRTRTPTRTHTPTSVASSTPTPTPPVSTATATSTATEAATATFTVVP